MGMSMLHRGFGMVLITIILFIIYISLWSSSSSLHNIKKLRTIINMIIPRKSSFFRKKTLSPSELLKLSKEINNVTSHHPIYKDFNIPGKGMFGTLNTLQQINILLVVSSGPGRLQRRNAIRRTWWKECQQKPNVRRV